MYEIGFLSFEGDPHLLAHRRVSAVRADHETGPQLAYDTVDVVPHSRSVAVAELDVRRAAYDGRTRTSGGVDQCLTGIRVAQVERAADTGHEHVHRDRRGLLRTLHVLVPGRTDVRACVEQHLLHAELARLSDSPALHALAADAVGKLRRGLEHGDAEALAGKRVGERGASDAAADDDDVCGCGHAGVHRPTGCGVNVTTSLTVDGLPARRGARPAWRPRPARPPRRRGRPPAMEG